MSAAYDPTALTALVADENHYQRGISVDMLRAMGIGRIVQAASGAEAWDLVLANRPDCIFTEWLAQPLDAPELIKRVRQSEDSPNREASVFVLTHRGARADVETARLAGADAYLRKPLSVSALQVRFKKVITNPQPFVTTAAYVGPCRRRRQDEFYLGPRRRLCDKIEEAVAQDEDDEVKTELVKARIAHLETMAMKLDPADANSARRVFAAAQQLREVAQQVEDSALTLAAKELVRYLETLGAAALDFEAMRTHIAALHQLAHLPNAMQAERTRVAQSLTKMVDKKIRQASAA